mmetsp:Transcript_865/g.1911  ORF Transcript_865/g.1911 Transcript_865/m.1911 type:complete len:188 (+) Transcript_865:233-796(+)|eukprot:CAMPEP_0114429428 /NCGR_PEP_ID=MMETSP0103-20121206/9483_1 /TAXON_ID=37642 ORGANISM="Paraphysomonas imperforata, Strain PA2" /NCGR_SAMPLE_ID=MMETSP0103 /ASSEMBLY_ACC=CAM_ASM_000201 /LENGTH=187 /DNA_ID=CAMNT_0001598769 /DNA_START=176 /DNA_END=739 /DNA_ORIENTATION=+
MSSPNRGIEKGRSTFFNPVDLPTITRDDIALTGFLVKEGGSWKSWKRRYFVLSRTGTLNYYEDANLAKAKGTLECKDCEIRLLPEQGKLYFEIAADVFNSVAGRCLKLQAESEEQMYEWVQAVRQVSCLYGDRDLSRKTSASTMRPTDGSAGIGGLTNINTDMIEELEDVQEVNEEEEDDEDCEPLC